MDFAFAPPRFLLYVLGAIVVIVVSSMALKKGRRRSKIASLAVLVVVVAVVLGLFYRSSTLTVDETGIHGDTFGKPSLAWSDVTDVILITDLADSEYQPKMKIAGAAFGTDRFGTFTLSGGGRATVAMNREDTALLVRTSERTYLFAVDDMSALTDAVSRYSGREVSGLTAPIDRTAARSIEGVSR